MVSRKKIATKQDIMTLILFKVIDIESSCTVLTTIVLLHKRIAGKYTPRSHRTRRAGIKTAI